MAQPTLKQLQLELQDINDELKMNITDEERENLESEKATLEEKIYEMQIYANPFTYTIGGL